MQPVRQSRQKRLDELARLQAQRAELLTQRAQAQAAAAAQAQAAQQQQQQQQQQQGNNN